MKERFSVEKIEQGQDGKVDSQLVKEAHATLNSELFVEFCVLVRTSGSILQKYAHALEGCQCHAEIWKEKSSWKSKKRKMEILTGSATCYMKGRQAGWWFSRGFDQCVGDLRKGDSTMFQSMLAKLDARTRGELVKLQTQLADSLAEELQEKFFFKDIIPYTIIKVFYESEIASGSQNKARTALKDCCDQYDRAIADGRGKKLHRVCHICFQEGTEVRFQAEQFINGGGALKGFPMLHHVTMRYALIPCVGRRVEACHAVLHRLGLMARNIEPPQLSAKNSLPDHLERLERDKEWMKFVLQKWRSRKLLDDLLGLVCNPEELAEMNRLQKIKKIYQCDMDTEFKDLSAERQAHAEWQQQTVAMRSYPKTFPPSWQAALLYLKTKLSAKCVFSLAGEEFLRALAEPPGDDQLNMAASDPWKKTLAVWNTSEVQFDMNLARDYAFFEVINAYPERRSNIVFHHLQTWSDRVLIRRRTVWKHDVASKRVILLSETGPSETLHLRPLIHYMTDTLELLFSWSSVVLGSALSWRMPNRPPALADAQPQLMANKAETVVLDPSTDLVVQVGASASQLDSVATCNLSDSDAIACLAKLQEMEAEEFGWVHFEEMQDVHVQTLLDLAQIGAVCVMNDEFGAIKAKRLPDGLKYVSLQTVGSPRQVLRQDAWSGSSKLDVVVALLRDGWTEGPRAPYKRGAVKKFIPERTRPLSYFMCVMQVDGIFAKGLKALRHDLKDYQYQCLLRLSGQRFLTFIAEIDNISQEQARLMLKDAGPDGGLEAPPLEDIARRDGGNRNAPDDLPQHLAPFDLSSLEWKRARVRLSGGDTSWKVTFDHFTGGTGMQKAYCNCVDPRHVNCVKWKNVDRDLWPTREAFMAYMAAWAAEAFRFANREEHMKFDPSEVSVAGAMRDINLEEW